VQVAAGYVRSMPRPDTLYLGHSGGVRYGELAPEEMEDDLPAESPLKADSLIAALAHKYPGEVTVITIGSMANIGQFLTRYPTAARKLKRIVTNGGNFTGEREEIGWNLRYDPVAALIALRSDVPWVLLSEATCRHASPRKEGVDRLREADTELTRYLLEGIHWWQTNKTDATTWPHVSDLNTFAYILGGYVETSPGHVIISVGPVGSLPGFRAVEDEDGKVTLGNDIEQAEAAVLRELFLRRLCEY
jgi:inosine-uridine nucleoside N-ribohydrolase